jgi:serine protease Do
MIFLPVFMTVFAFAFGRPSCYIRRPMKHRFVILLLGTVWLQAAVAGVDPARSVIDDDEYLDKVIEAGVTLLDAGKLMPLATLRKQVCTKGARLHFAPPARQKLEPPDLYERLRTSTLAVGSLYKCPDCDDWHFNSSAGFVVAEGGIVCTCCHVVTAEDEGVKEAYLMAADASGHVYSVRSVVAADTESDTCFVKIETPGLKPLPLRSGVRTGERVYCLSHPGGYYFMFTQGMVARLNRRPNDVLDAKGKSTGEFTRPILFLNVTAEFAPGSSGAPIADEAGNVVAQVASIADAGEPEAGTEDVAPSPSVPVRFCTATEEILRLADPNLKGSPKSERRKPKPEVRKLRR